MEPWWKVAEPRKEVREGRSFNPNEFAIALEQVVAGTAPEDYRDPQKFFARNVFTRALTDHTGMVLRRLAGRTENTAPVLTLITQFGGGKTHTLTALYHLVRAGAAARRFEGVPEVLAAAGLQEVPGARVGVFVGNAWDPQPGRETPWLDLARQLAEDAGVEALGPSAGEIAPGTDTLNRLFQTAGGSVLVLFDEVLNFLNRHRSMADQFYAFLQNLTVAMTGTTRSAAMISLPRSQVEMSEWDTRWEDRITKVVHRVARDLIVLDEAEISEVVRRRLFENLGPDRVRKNVARAFADWCFDRRAQLPPEWTAVDTAATDARARDFLRQRFETAYPFHPATLSVFQRKWQALTHYQRTRGTLAMLAQWISLAYREGFTRARREPLITLGSAPLDAPDFRSVVLGQLGEPRLTAAIETDLVGQVAHARALDADARGALADIHRRVGVAIFFESSGGQVDKVAHLPELRFALGEPEVETTSIDNAAVALENRAFFIRRIGTDGFRIGYQPTLRKVVNDRRASLDEESEVKPAMRTLVQEEFRRGAAIPLDLFPADGDVVGDVPRLKIVVLAPDLEWRPEMRQRIAAWTTTRGSGGRQYPAALVWCVKKPGREFQHKVETWLAWQRVQNDFQSGALGEDFERGSRSDIASRVQEAREDARDEVWASYTYVVVSDRSQPDGLRVIDLGAGHASAGETLTGRVVSALKRDNQLNESVGAGYIERHWPEALRDQGAWPLAGLRQSFLDGSLVRLLDPDAVLKAKIVEFVERGDFGLASGRRIEDGYEHVWYGGPVSSDEVEFSHDVYLLKRERALELKHAGGAEPVGPQPGPEPAPPPPLPGPGPQPLPSQTVVRLGGALPPELWNRVGTRLIPKLRSAGDLTAHVELSLVLEGERALGLVSEVREILADLELTGRLQIEETRADRSE